MLQELEKSLELLNHHNEMDWTVHIGNLNIPP